MRILTVFSLIIFSFGAISYGALLLIYLRQRWEGSIPADSPVMVGVTLLGTVWFLLNLVVVAVELTHQPSVWKFYGLMMSVALLFPPLVMDIYLSPEEPYLRRRIIWRGTVRVTYAVSWGLAVLGVPFVLTETLSMPPSERLRVMMVTLFVLFIIAMTFVFLTLSRSGRKHAKPEHRGKRRWHLLLTGIGFLVFVTVLLSMVVELPYMGFLGVFSRSLPLYFTFVATYYENRFEFFDIFIKLGAFFLLSLLLLSAFYSALFHFMEGLFPEWSRPWVYAVIT